MKIELANRSNWQSALLLSSVCSVTAVFLLHLSPISAIIFMISAVVNFCASIHLRGIEMHHQQWDNALRQYEKLVIKEPDNSIAINSALKMLDYYEGKP